MAKVIIEVEWGAVQNVYSDSEDVKEYIIIDRDIQDEDDGPICTFRIEPIPREIAEEIEQR